MVDQSDKVLDTVAEPEVIQQGDFGALLGLRLYEKTPLTRKYLVVLYREVSLDDGFVLTAYFARRPSVWRATLWSR